MSSLSASPGAGRNRVAYATRLSEKLDLALEIQLAMEEEQKAAAAAARVRFRAAGTVALAAKAFARSPSDHLAPPPTRETDELARSLSRLSANGEGPPALLAAAAAVGDPKAKKQLRTRQAEALAEGAKRASRVGSLARIARSASAHLRSSPVDLDEDLRRDSSPPPPGAPPPELPPLDVARSASPRLSSAATHRTSSPGPPPAPGGFADLGPMLLSARGSARGAGTGSPEPARSVSLPASPSSPGALSPPAWPPPLRPASATTTSSGQRRASSLSRLAGERPARLPEWTAAVAPPGRRPPPFAETGLLEPRVTHDRNEVRELKRIFDAFDRKQSGEISRADIAAGPENLRAIGDDLARILSWNPYQQFLCFDDVLRAVYPTATPQQMESKLKWSKPSKTHPTESAAVKEEKAAHKNLTDEQLAEVRALFNLYDTDHTGVISHEDLMRAGRSSGLTDEDLERILTRLEAGGGHGGMTLDEFVSLCEPLFNFSDKAADGFWRRTREAGRRSASATVPAPSSPSDRTGPARPASARPAAAPSSFSRPSSAASARPASAAPRTRP